MLKLTFTTALVAVYTFAQDTAMDVPADEVNNPLLEIFEKNAAGQWQLGILPNLPQISFTDVDD